MPKHKKKKGNNKGKKKGKASSIDHEIAKQRRGNAKQQKAELKQLNKRDKYQKKDSPFKRMCNQLRPLGLELRDPRSDGNCLFRALSDQLEGNESNHKYYRKDIVNYMKVNSNEFSPFYIGDFDKYLKQMGRNAEWGGNMELIAISKCYKLDIVIHQLDGPRYEILYQLGKPVRSIHLSYSEGKHYMSVRNMTDCGKGAAEEIFLDGKHEQRAKELKRQEIMLGHQGIKPDLKTGKYDKKLLKNGLKRDKKKVKKGEYKGIKLCKNEKIVIQSTMCMNIKHIREVLEWNENDVNSTIEYLLMEKNDFGPQIWNEIEPKNGDKNDNHKNNNNNNKPDEKESKVNNKKDNNADNELDLETINAIIECEEQNNPYMDGKLVNDINNIIKQDSKKDPKKDKKKHKKKHKLCGCGSNKFYKQCHGNKDKDKSKHNNKDKSKDVDSFSKPPKMSTCPKANKHDIDKDDKDKGWSNVNNKKICSCGSGLKYKKCCGARQNYKGNKNNNDSYYNNDDNNGNSGNSAIDMLQQKINKEKGKKKKQLQKKLNAMILEQKQFDDHVRKKRETLSEKERKANEINPESALTINI